MSEFPRLRSTEDLDTFLDASRSGPVVLFKHSLACGVSFSALRELERFAEGALGAGTHVAVLEIQNARPLSNEVAERSGVRHASPQVLVFCDGEVSWDGSHWKITADRLEEVVREAACSTVAEV